MSTKVRELAKTSTTGLFAAIIVVGLGAATGAQADEAGAKKLLKAMSTYLAGQNAISYDYDSTLEVVTKDDQKLTLSSSGSTTLNRPDKIRASRTGGFSDVETLFDGKTLTLFGKNVKLYTQIEAPGTIDQLIDLLKDKYNRPLPAADLLLTNSYDKLMDGVTDTKDLGSGVINGVECNWLAFRAKEVDWQIWIAQGDMPYPCRYSITSKKISGAPQYIVQVRNWKTGDKVGAVDFAFKAADGTKKIDPKDLKKQMGALPDHFKLGAAQ